MSQPREPREPRKNDGWLSRRNVLRGAGVALALPWLESLAPRAARAQAVPPRRSFVAMYFPCGVADFWRPTATGTGNAWTLSPILEPLAPLKPFVNVLSSVGNYGPFGGHIEPSHGNLTGAVLSCTKPTRDPANPLGTTSFGGVSVDQVIAKAIGNRTKLDSLQVGLSTLDSSPDGVPAAFSRSISWRSPTEPLYKLVSPQAVFDRIVSSSDGAFAPRRAADKSVLDYVLGHAATVKGQLGRSDRARLDQFLTSVRGLETDIQSAVLSGCAAVPRPTETFDVGNVPPGYDRGKHADLMIDLVVMALQCDVTRVVSFMLDDSRSDFVYNFLAERHFTPTTSTPGTAPCGSLHGLTAAGNTNNGWATINRWFVEKLARLCGKLQAIPDGSATLLDSTAVWFGSEMHGGNHDGLDLPIVTVGGGGGRLRTNQSIDFATTARQTERLANLHLTFIRSVFDLPDQTFGGVPDAAGFPGPAGTAPPNALGNGTTVIPELLA
jgi:hypothetical protein